MLARLIKALKSLVVNIADMDAPLRCMLCVPVLLTILFVATHPVVGLILLGLIALIMFLGIVFIPWLGEKCKEDLKGEQ